MIKRATFGFKWFISFAVCAGVALLWYQFPTTCMGVLERILNIPFAQIVLFCVLLLIVRVLWKVQEDPSINFVDLLKGPDGKASWSKMSGIGAFIIASWFVVDSRIVGNITWELIVLLLIYAAVYTANPIAFAVINLAARLRGVSSDQPVQTTTTTGPAEIKITTPSSGE